MITDRATANRYYSVVNELIDEYIDKWGINPVNLLKYLKMGSTNYERFLKRNRLENIKGIHIVIKDILEDRVSIAKDAPVMTFENFQENDTPIKRVQDCFLVGIEPADLSLEMLISDEFDVNLSDVDSIDSKAHLFEVEDWNGNRYQVKIYKLDEYEVIKHNFVEYYNLLVLRKKLSISDIDIDLSGVVDTDKFKEKFSGKLTDEFICKNLSKSLNLNDFDFVKNDKCVYWKIKLR